MKTKISLPVILIGFAVIFSGCKNLTSPVLITSDVTSITSITATVGGNVTSDGGASVSDRGIYWGTAQYPESNGTKLQIGSGTGSFSTALTGLTTNTTYYVKAYAINSQGIAYGSQVSFKTLTSTGGTIPTNGLVAYYPFNGNCNDESGNGNNGINSGATLTQDKNGINNKAYLFNGSSNYISVPHNSVFNFGTGNFSVCALIKTGVIPTGSWTAIVTKHNTATWHDTEFFTMIEGGTGKPFFGLSTNDGVFERIYGSVNICDNQYHTLCGIIVNGQIKFYVDGVLVATSSSTINPDNSNPINIGRSSYSGGYGYFNGVIDEVLIYNRALTEAEITNLFK